MPPKTVNVEPATEANSTSAEDHRNAVMELMRKRRMERAEGEQGEADETTATSEGDNTDGTTSEPEPGSDETGTAERQPELEDEHDPEPVDDGDAEEAPDADEEEGEGGDEPDEEGEDVVFDDEDIVLVKVDGEVREVPFGEVSRALSGLEAIDARIQEASEARNSAAAAREQATRNLHEMHEAFSGTFAQLEGVLLSATVEKPSEEMRRTDLERYVAQLDAYNEDQARIADNRSKLSEVLDKLSEARQTQMTEARSMAMTELANARPALKTQEGAKQFTQNLFFAAKQYGFNEDELALVTDPRLLALGADLGEFLRKRADNRSTTSKGDSQEGGRTSERRGRKPRVLRAAASVSSRKQAAKVRTKEVESAKQRAAQTGSRDDVLRFLQSKRG